MFAQYFDGQSARMQAVDLVPGADALALHHPGFSKSYPFDQVRLAEQFAGAPCVIDFADGARCELADAQAHATLSALLGRPASPVLRWQKHWYGALAALVVLIICMWASVEWGIPAVAETLVARLPASLDVELGKQSIAALEERGAMTTSRYSDERIAEITAVFDGIKPAATRLPLRLLVRNIAGMGPNAFASPDGTIVVNDAMIRAVAGDGGVFDEVAKQKLAGVLAHEIGHIQGRHSVRAIARSSLTMAASGAMFGDFSAIAAGAPTLLLNLNHSRAMEMDADNYAIGLLRAQQISPSVLADLFDTMEKRERPDLNPLPSWLRGGIGSYLSSHPPSVERSARFRAGAPALTR